MHLRALILAFTCAFLDAAHAAPVTQTITYQGELTENGSPKSGTIDVVVKIFDAANGGAQFEVVEFPDVSVTRGLFTLPITLDNIIFFEGGDWWLEVSVRDGASVDAHIAMAPRQLITAVPYALNAATVGGQNATALLQGAVGKSAYKRAEFSNKLIGASNTLHELDTLTVHAPADGTVAFKARGDCDVAQSGEGVFATLRLGSTPAEALQAPPSTRGEVNMPPLVQSAGASFTAERPYQVSANQTRFMVLYGERGTGSAQIICAGSLTAEFFPASL